jgi:hypothetical protein
MKSNEIEQKEKKREKRERDWIGKRDGNKNEEQGEYGAKIKKKKFVADEPK